MALKDFEFDQTRQFEGPPELIYEHKSKLDVYDRRGMLGGKSVADRLTKDYGEEGTGWGIWKSRYIAENELKDYLHAKEFNPATEAFMNVLRMGKYQLNDGTDMTGKVQRYVRDPDIVDVVLYPDGKAYAEKQFTD
jgi:hypothetical protein